MPGNLLPRPYPNMGSQDAAATAALMRDRGIVGRAPRAHNTMTQCDNAMHAWARDNGMPTYSYLRPSSWFCREHHSYHNWSLKSDALSQL